MLKCCRGNPAWQLQILGKGHGLHHVFLIKLLQVGKGTNVGQGCENVSVFEKTWKYRGWKPSSASSHKMEKTSVNSFVHILFCTLFSASFINRANRIVYIRLHSIIIERNVDVAIRCRLAFAFHYNGMECRRSHTLYVYNIYNVDLRWSFRSHSFHQSSSSHFFCLSHYIRRSTL
jgi:hypothetical protein